MSEPASISAGIAERYATAIFEIAQEENSLDALKSSVNELGTAVNESAELRTVLASPLISRDEQGAAIAALSDKMGLAPVMQNV
ncbi:MAG: F0F1 ATP synthase subunit delta, partial [Arenibacterium sp.]